MASDGIDRQISRNQISRQDTRILVGFMIGYNLSLGLSRKMSLEGQRAHIKTKDNTE